MRTTIRSELYLLLFPNGKMYVGMTTRTAESRLARHRYDASRGRKTPLADAIRKYPDSISLTTLAVGDREYILEMEKRYIAHLGTQWPDVGYNIAPGGEIAPTIVPEVAARVSASMMGNQNSLGFRHSDDTRLKISKSKLGNQHCTGYVQHPEHVRRRVEARKRTMAAHAAAQQEIH